MSDCYGVISLFRERFSDQYVFYRLDDIDRTNTYGVRDSTLADFVTIYKNQGGLDFLYSKVIAKEMALPGEHVKDIRTEDGAILWTNPLAPFDGDGALN
jgi:hypothetical protein